MSNIKCPTCGIVSYDCGKAGYKTAREIELEKKLEIAKKCLKEYAVFNCKDSWFAETALEQIKELDEVE